MVQKMTVICCRCTVRECFGTLMWPLSWFWLLKMTDYQSSKCGTFVSPRRPLKFLKTTPGEDGFNTFWCFSFSDLMMWILLTLSFRGILSISWSQADSELLLSSAKDNRILCWNPNTGEVSNNCRCFILSERHRLSWTSFLWNSLILVFSFCFFFLI